MVHEKINFRSWYNNHPENNRAKMPYDTDSSFYSAFMAHWKEQQYFKNNRY